MNIDFSDPRSYLDVYTIEEFCRLVSLGVLIDYDGFGYFGTETSESETRVPLDVDIIKRMARKHGFTHVYAVDFVYFNYFDTSIYC